jgi:AcrR family transcriptional regulator
VTTPIRSDRRHQRRQQTIEQVLDLAVEVMAEQGVAGLTLGEVARRMGIRPPSLYGYFDGKNALYDALFERGWRLFLADLRTTDERLRDDAPAGRLRTASEFFVRWAVEHPAYAPLMFWRPVPGFVPSEAAYAPSREAMAMAAELITGLRDGGVIRADVDLDLAVRTWTALTSGVVSQQLANAPGEPYETGTFSSTVPELVAMWLAHFGPSGTTPSPS